MAADLSIIDRSDTLTKIEPSADYVPRRCSRVTARCGPYDRVMTAYDHPADDHLTTLRSALTSPDAYPHQPQHVTCVQTHISLVFLAGKRVYKIKKPVDLGFVDFTSLDDRRHFCEEELRLNRRLASPMYLGLAHVVRTPDGTIHIDDPTFDAPTAGKAHMSSPDGDTIDYAVVMRRLPEGAMLNHRLERGEIDNELLDNLAHILVDFHARCPTDESISAFASPDALRRQIRDNLDGLATGFATLRTRGALVDDAIVDFAGRALLRFIDDHASLLLERIAQGRVREGHGDLHARNICVLTPSEGVLTPGVDREIVIYDCIEFSKAFRCRDVACEIAFLAMDLDFNGDRAFSAYFIRKYAEVASDDSVRALVPFYKAHFAVVRAKVEALRANDEGVDDEDRREATTLATSYMQLAAGYLLPPSIIIMTGLPGTGKSSAARAIAQPLGARIVRSDVVRKELVGLAPADRSGAGDVENLYSPAMTERTYEAMLEHARHELERGRHVVIDATTPCARVRSMFIELASSRSAPSTLVWTTAPDDVVRKRMDERATHADEPSDADWNVYIDAKERFDAPQATDNTPCIKITHDQSRTSIIENVLRSLVSKTQNAATPDTACDATCDAHQN